MKNQLVNLSIEREKEVKKGNYATVVEIDRYIEEICLSFREGFYNTLSQVRATRERGYK